MNDKNKLNYRDFKVIEFDGKYFVFRRKRITKVTGHLWWKVTTISWEWRRVDKNGDIRVVSSRFAFPFHSLKPFKTLCEAMTRIDVFVKGQTTHYHPKAFEVPQLKE